jgi:hypothetical protein
VGYKKSKTKKELNLKMHGSHQREKPTTIRSCFLVKDKNILRLNQGNSQIGKAAGVKFFPFFLVVMCLNSLTIVVA